MLNKFLSFFGFVINVIELVTIDFELAINVVELVTIDFGWVIIVVELPYIKDFYYALVFSQF